MTIKQKNYKLIPEGEFRCVWMSAGILAYQLCDRSFDCDRCPLDKAMREHFLQPQAGGEKGDQASLPAHQGGTLPEGLRYTASHYWVKPLAAGKFRVGIEAGLARALLIPGTIILPNEGETVAAGKPCAWFVEHTKTVPFHAFAGGRVVGSNSLLAERPYKVFFHPYDQGWLFDLAPEKEIASQLLDAPEAQRAFDRDEKLFRDGLRQALPQAPCGATMQDGGEALQDISLMLGPDRYFNLLGEIFLNKKA